MKVIFNDLVIWADGTKTAVKCEGEKFDPEKVKEKKMKVIFNDPATIVMWADGTKTVVKCEGEKFDPEKGLAMAITKKALGNKGNYYDIFRKFIPEEKKTVSINKDKLMSVADFAQLNGISQTTVRRGIKTGYYHAFKDERGRWRLPVIFE